MKTVFICILSLSFLGSFAQKNNDNEHPIKISVELPDTVYVGQRVPIILKIENTTSKALLISHPATWGHIYTSLKQRELKGKTSEIQIRIANAIKIKEYETLKIKVGALNDSYYLPGSSYSLGSHQLGKNNIYVKYYYEPKKIVRKRKMLLVTSVTEKFVISDVFTF